MRDYSNGGFFFIDVTVTMETYQSGRVVMDLDETFADDVKRAIKAGKIFAITGITNVAGVIAGAYVSEDTVYITAPIIGMNSTAIITVNPNGVANFEIES